MSFSYLPEQTRINASRSRCLGSIFACILKTNPEKSCDCGIKVPSVVFFSAGAGAIAMKSSRKLLTPKSFTALPKKTGVSSPLRIRSKSKGSPAALSKDSSSLRIEDASFPIRCSNFVSFISSDSTVNFSAPEVCSLLKSSICFSCLL